MKRIRMNQAVNWGDGLVASPREMIDRGLATARRREATSYTCAETLVERPNGDAVKVSDFVPTGRAKP